jgi:hypothetical protein
MDNILFIPGIANPVSEINSLLFGAGQQGTFIAPSLTPSLISGSTFGTGVETLPDLSPRNNPFSQATSGSRAAWFREPKRGRVNLLVQTEPATTATGWTNTGALATNIGNGVMHWVEDTSTGTHAIIQVVTIADGTNVTYSIQVKSDGSGRRVRFFALQGSSPFTFMSQIIFDTSSNTVISTVGTATATDVGDGWFELILQGNTTGSNMRFQVDAVSASNQASYTGNGSGFFYRRPQFETGATRTAYQRVTTAFDVTEAGQRDCYGVRADGIDDWYATGSIDATSASAMTAFVSLRKISEVATNGYILGTQTAGAASSGQFRITFSSGNSYRAGYAFNTSDGVGSGVFAPAPSTDIIVLQINRSTGIASLRRNGVTLFTVNTGIVAGVFNNEPLSLLRNPNGAEPANMRFYASIWALGSYPLSTIQRVERLLSRITPTVNL